MGWDIRVCPPLTKSCPQVSELVRRYVFASSGRCTWDEMEPERRGRGCKVRVPLGLMAGGGGGEQNTAEGTAPARPASQSFPALEQPKPS